MDICFYVLSSGTELMLIYVMFLCVCVYILWMCARVGQLGEEICCITLEAYIMCSRESVV